MGKNLKLSLVKLGSSEELGDHPAALMMAEVFVPESYGDLIFCLLLFSVNGSTSTGLYNSPVMSSEGDG